MWRFYNRHTKQKVGRFGRSNVSCSWVTLKYLWLKSLLLLLFCLDCSCAPTENQSSVSMSSAESLPAKLHFSVLKMTSHAHEIQRSPIPVWKPEVLKSMLEVLKAHVMMREKANHIIPHKLYKPSRLFKRDLGQFSDVALTLAEIIEKLLGQTASNQVRSLSGLPEGPLNDTVLNPLLMTPGSVTPLHPFLFKWGPQAETQAPPTTWGPQAETQAPPTTWGPQAETQAPPTTWGPQAETQAPPTTWGPQAETQAPPTTWGPQAETQAPPTTWGPQAETQAPPTTWGPQAETQAPPTTWGPQAETQAPPTTWGPQAETQAPPTTWGPQAETQAPPTTWGPQAETQAPPTTWGPQAETQAPPTTWGPQAETQAPPTTWGNVVSHMETFLDTKTLAKVGGHMLSTLKDTTFARPEELSSIGSLEKQEQAAASDTFLVQSEGILHTTPQGFSYSSGKPIAKPINYPNLSGSPFPITDPTKVPSENRSHQSSTFNHEINLSSTNNALNELPSSDHKTVEPATNRVNVLDATFQPEHKTHTFSNMLIPGLETSPLSLQHSDVTGSLISPTNSTLDSSTESVNTQLYSQNSEPPLPILQFDSLEVDWGLASVTPQTLAIVDRSSTKRNVETTTLLNTDHANRSYVTTQRIGRSSATDSTPVGTFFSLSGLGVRAKQDFSTTPTILHISKTDQASEHDGRLEQRSSTSRTFSASTWPSQTMGTREMSPSISLKTSHQTDINTLSSVSQSTYRVKGEECVLRLDDPTNTPTPKESKTSRSPTVSKSPDYESGTTVLSTSNAVTPNGESTRVESTFTAGLESQSTMMPTFANNAFNDVMNENGKINQSTFSPTSTVSPTMPSTRVGKPLTSVTSQWKSRTSQQFNSTLESVQNIKTSNSTLYSTLPNKVSLNIYATDSQTPNTTTVPAALQRTSSVKSSTYHLSTQNPFLGSIFSVRDPMDTRPRSSSPRQSQAVTATVTHLYPTTNIGPLSSAPSTTLTASSTTTSRLAALTQSTKIPLGLTTLAFKVSPVPKEWVPQTDLPLKPKSATTINSTRQEVGSTATTVTPAVTMPLNFYLTGVSFSEQLKDNTSEEYRNLEREVKLVMDNIFPAKYESAYLATEITGFLKGSVIVQSIVVFQNKIVTPSSSDLVRTVLTAGTKTNYFGWSINGSTVESNGYTMSNLELEVLPISLLVLRAGFIAVSPNNQEMQSFLDNLQKVVFQAINKSFPITNVSISQIRDVFGDLQVRGYLSLNSTAHTDVQSLMSSLVPLADRSVDLSSILVNGIGNDVKVHSINFRVTNKAFVLDLLDMSSSESQLLSKNLSGVVQTMLQDSSLLQVIMREFKSGSVICRGDLVYRLPAPGSGEVLRLFLKILGSDSTLGSSIYKVDSKSVSIGDSRPGPSYEYVDFPGFGVAIIVMCGLCILIFPIIVFVCIKTRMLGRRKKATIQRRHELDNQSHHLEMDNRAFRASIEQP